MPYKYYLRFFIISMFGLATPLSMAEKLSPFTSDGCSLFPDGTADTPSLWLHCCMKHDLAYWAGGSLDKKHQADKALAKCVKQTGQATISQLMHSGVVLGGSAYYPTFYRWGYGWPYLRGYQALTPDEKTAVIAQLNDTKRHINEYLRTITPNP